MASSTLHFNYIRMRSGETVAEFLKQFEHLPKDLVIPWENFTQHEEILFQMVAEKPRG